MDGRGLIGPPPAVLEIEREIELEKLSNLARWGGEWSYEVGRRRCQVWRQIK